MNRVIRGTVVLAAVIGVLSCKGDPTSDLRNGVDHLLASPLQLFVNEGASKNVVVTAVDAQGNLLGTKFTLGTVGAGISVVEDDSFNLVYDNNGNLVRPSNPTRVRYIVTGTANTADTYFKVSAAGKTDSIAVRVLPTNLPTPALSATAPALGDTLSLTVAAPYRYTDSSTVTIIFPGDTVAGIITGLSTDSRTIFFIPPPGVNAGTVFVDNVVLDYAQVAATFTITASGALTTPATLFFPATLSTTTPAQNDTVTVTLGTGWRFLPGATVSAGGNPGYVVSISADSLTMKFVPGPGAPPDSVRVDGVALSFLTALSLTLPANSDFTPPAAGYSGTDAFATAPTLTFPTSGNSTVFADEGAMAPVATCTGDLGGNCRVYKFVLGATTTFTMTATWEGTTDLGIYFYDNTQSLLSIFGCDANGDGTDGQPETCDVTLNAGTYYFVADDFGPFYNPPDPEPKVLFFNIAVQ